MYCMLMNIWVKFKLVLDKSKSWSRSENWYFICYFEKKGFKLVKGKGCVSVNASNTVIYQSYKTIKNDREKLHQINIHVIVCLLKKYLKEQWKYIMKKKYAWDN